MYLIMVCILLYLCSRLTVSSQSTASQCDVTLQAAGLKNTNEVTLVRVPQDSKLAHSLICDDVAGKTGAELTTLGTAVTLIDENGQSYVSKTKVSLQWRRTGTQRSDTEDFLVVKALSGGVGARFRNGVVFLEVNSTPGVSPVVLSRQTDGALADCCTDCPRR